MGPYRRARMNADDMQQPGSNPAGWTRRGFIVTMLATGALAACGESDDSSTPAQGSVDAAAPDSAATGSAPADTAPAGSTPAGSTPAGSTGEGSAAGTAPTDGYTIVQRFPQAVQVPGPLRLPVSLSDGDGALLQDVPATLTAQVFDEQGTALGERLEAVRRDAVPAPYYDFRTSIETPGFYVLQVEGGTPDGASFDVADPSTVEIPIPGQPLPALDTPTVADPAGVDPICTREPEACPFHDVTLTEALASGKQVAYYVGTPAFCSTGVCAPGLESLIEVHDDYADTHVFVHAEVYTDNKATTLTPAVEALHLFYEPVLFVTDTAGVILERVDAVFNTDELIEVLDRSRS